uniref:Transient receptor potential cation channel, subfamily M, member 2 n=1 Tax=Oncorhynchus kisutch TaxID=8019 RepID=A0A8C7N794_ONCKI
MGESLLLEPSLAQTLAVSAAKTSKLSLSTSTQRSLAAWIKDNIRKKECCFYVNSDSKGICKCGYQRIHHVDDSIKPENYLGETWDRHRHVHEVPTDAYGDIWFGGLGQKIGRYVRVSSDTSPDLLYQLLTEQWKLPPPNLLISVTGGAKNFYMKPHLTALFRRGLIKVAQTTGAWIITGGTHAGVMKHVGQAVREYVLSSGSMEGQIVAIGVATWGAIHNRRPLVHHEGRFPAHYSLDMQSQGHLSCLDNNHSHFLLVDDGTHGCYGVEIELRSRLERLISQQPLGNRGRTRGNGFHISFELHTKPDQHLVALVIRSRLPGNTTALVLIQVYLSLSSPLPLPANRSSESVGMERWERQLELAVAWNRVDIAKTDIFTEDSQWKSSDLHQAMFSALLGHKPQFVQLLLENGVCLREFLGDQTTLCDLYTQLPTSCFFLRRLRKNIITLNMFVRFLQSRDCTSAALAASKILKKLAEEGAEEEDEAEEMRELAKHYETHAIGVFNECHCCDEERAQRLLIRISSSWGQTTCLRLALEADDKSFVAHSGVQALLTQIWCGELAADNPLWRVLLCMLFFPLIYTGFLGFSFLLLFSVVLMIDFQTTPSWREGLLYVWLISLVCEEVRQVRHIADMYINDMWNILDFLSILLFIIGLAFRLTTRLFYAGKVILCIDFIIFCLRLMAIFIISKTLGPKIIIVRRMMLDMFFFMFLLSIWVVAYGVAKQGILIHNEDRLDWIVRGVIYEPYLIIFGNMPSNIDNALFDIKACSVNGTESQKPKCPILNEDKMPAFPEWLTIILLCVYLLFANILLLNLLIAIFNYTFQEVQDNTDTIWKFQRYELIKEYHSRPAAPPPLILLSHIFLFIRRIVLQRPPNSYRAFSES